MDKQKELEKKVEKDTKKIAQILMYRKEIQKNETAIKLLKIINFCTITALFVGTIISSIMHINSTICILGMISLFIINKISFELTYSFVYANKIANTEKLKFLLK